MVQTTSTIFGFPPHAILSFAEWQFGLV